MFDLKELKIIAKNINVYSYDEQEVKLARKVNKLIQIAELKDEIEKL